MKPKQWTIATLFFAASLLAISLFISSCGSPGSGNPYFGGEAVVGTKGGDDDYYCFLMNGGAKVHIHGSGVYINCSSSDALFMNGGTTLIMDTAGQVVGCYYVNSHATYDPFKITCGANGGVSQTIDANTFATVPATLTPPTCSSNGSVLGNTYSPGNFTDIVITNITAVFSPGVYCISGNLNLNGNATLSGPTGVVKIVLQDQSIILNGDSTITFNDLEIYGHNASFTLNDGTIFRANRLRYFSTGTGTFTVNSSSELTSDNAYLYLYRGDLVWRGNPVVSLHTPPAGDPFSGLLVYKPWGNTDETTFNGSPNIHLTGTFLVPSSKVIFNGANFKLHSQVIADSFLVNGNTDVDIYYVASENYQPPNAP